MANQPVQTVSTTNDKIKVVIALCAVVAGVVAFYLLADQSTLTRAGALVAGILVAVGMMWTSTPGRDFVAFGKDAVRETKKVVWPTQKEATQLTLIVFGFVLLMAVFLWGTDKILEVLLSFILGWK